MPKPKTRKQIEEQQRRPKLWRVCVWGGDDYGLEFDYTSRLEALEAYDLITDYTTQEALRAYGFYPV